MKVDIYTSGVLMRYGSELDRGPQGLYLSVIRANDITSSHRLPPISLNTTHIPNRNNPNNNLAMRPIPMPIHIPFITRLRALFTNPSLPNPPPTHTSPPKIALIGLSSVGKHALLNHLTTTPISSYTPDITVSAHVHFASNHHLGMDFVLVELGESAPRWWIKATTGFYVDACAILVVVDYFNPLEVGEVRGCLDLILGMKKRGEGYVTVMERGRWLVVVNFKGEGRDELKARELVEGLRMDELGVNWEVRAIGTATGEGIPEVVSWLREKVVPSSV
ncbi:hypothetical protein BO94DRAFT_579871 [Aspergillus sclerotioniger CBS 115572]|uniref:P-loop containing nucleoside triphosphate hydrolase protein n=1 Tax=Aspergillus sclerotioniger CBS 115572 TaxID=1450535 RepID=A0A317UV86_9EURO|nr:hypothetical protein BO94DRAFT_579871 [Aspergillus sclerotioniger CBS 115572]PWY65361.1 hypothetical protein BO94DRAFT_579871 [Aspergillus sclerotioniger CBS 115572]